MSDTRDYEKIADSAMKQLAEKDAEIAALKVVTDRIVFDRTDNTLPTTKCLTLLNDGQISIGKAIEWLRVYFATGLQQPIADGTGPSVWDDIEALNKQLAEAKALLKDWLTFTDMRWPILRVRTTTFLNPPQPNTEKGTDNGK